MFNALCNHTKEGRLLHFEFRKIYEDIKKFHKPVSEKNFDFRVNVRLRPIILINWLVNFAKNVKPISDIVRSSTTTVVSTIWWLSKS